MPHPAAPFRTEADFDVLVVGAGHAGTAAPVAAARLCAATGGRAGEGATTHLAEQLERLGLGVSRFKTGTPPRIDGRSVDYSALARQPSELEEFGYRWSHFGGDGSRGDSPGMPLLADRAPS